MNFFNFIIVRIYKTLVVIVLLSTPVYWFFGSGIRIAVIEKKPRDIDIKHVTGYNRVVDVIKYNI